MTKFKDAKPNEAAGRVGQGIDLDTGQPVWVEGRHTGTKVPAAKKKAKARAKRKSGG